MKIGPLDSKPAVTQPAERKTSTSSATKGAEPSAQVALSSAATQITSTATDPTFDTKKVARIAQAIRDGQFKVNPEAIADKLIINAQELLGPDRKPN
jgi:negative regulator of flagellin synthesis FlgM